MERKQWRFSDGVGPQGTRDQSCEAPVGQAQPHARHSCSVAADWLAHQQQRGQQAPVQATQPLAARNLQSRREGEGKLRSNSSWQPADGLSSSSAGSPRPPGAGTGGVMRLPQSTNSSSLRLLKPLKHRPSSSSTWTKAWKKPRYSTAHDSPAALPSSCRGTPTAAPAARLAPAAPAATPAAMLPPAAASAAAARAAAAAWSSVRRCSCRRVLTTQIGFVRKQTWGRAGRQAGRLWGWRRESRQGCRMLHARHHRQKCSAPSAEQGD